MMVLVLIMILSCMNPIKKEPMENSRQFFKKLSKNGGIWVHLPSDTTMAFNSFIMKFKLQQGDTLMGKIFGSTKTGDTIPFWDIEEYMETGKDSIIFKQQGQYGNAYGKSFFPNSTTRESNFQMVYSNGAAQKHKDTHTFLNDSTLLTKSQIFDDQAQKWIKQPDALWTIKRRTEKKP